MSAVCVLTPIVVAAWPALASAIVGAAASMGFSIQASSLGAEKRSRRRRVEVQVENSEVIAGEFAGETRIVAQKGDIAIEFTRDESGACTVCAIGENHSEKELRQVAEEAAGRVVQQFVYHKLMTELKKRNFSIVGEEVLQDQSVHIRVRRQ